MLTLLLCTRRGSLFCSPCAVFLGRAARTQRSSSRGAGQIIVPLSSAFQGVLRIHFIEAQDLQGKDTYLRGLVKGKSDPYGVIRVGNQIFQSKVIKENLSPKWNEVYEVSASRLPPALSPARTRMGFI